MRVPIYRLENAQEKKVGYFVWDGQEVRVDPNSQQLQYYASKPYSIVINGEKKIMSPRKNPEEWLKWLHINLNGSYMWAGKLED